MVEWIVDARERHCHNCRKTWRSLAQHWTKSDCPEREFTESLHGTVRGLLLGDGSLEADEKPVLAVTSERRPHIEWLHDQLGWLSRGITREDRGEYRIRTMAHSDLGRYRSWVNAPPTGWTLTPQPARIWYACDGALSWTGRDRTTRQVTFAAENDSKREALVVLLNQDGFDATAWDRRIALSSTETGRWLEWLGDPTPGSEYKWAGSLAEYRAIRDGPDSEVDYLVALCRHALQVARSRTDQRIDSTHFDEIGESVDAKTVAEVLGGGDFADALSVAGIDPAPQEPYFRDETDHSPTSSQEPPPLGSRSRIDPEVWSREDCLEAVGAVASETDGPLRSREYTTYRRRQTDNLPSIQFMCENHDFDSWNDILLAAGLEVVRVRTDEATYELFLDGLIAIREETGEWPTTGGYRDSHPGWAPALGTAYRMEAFTSWRKAIADARDQFSSSDE